MKIAKLELFKVPPRWLFLKMTTVKIHSDSHTGYRFLNRRHPFHCRVQFVIAQRMSKTLSSKCTGLGFTGAVLF